MDAMTTIAAAGLRARMESLDLLANNLANTSSPGFKAGRESYSLYLSEEAAAAQDAAGGPLHGLSPLIERQWTDLSQGTLVTSGNPQDIALSGSGFFVVTGPQGPLLTRGGTIEIGSDGRITTREGYEFETVEPRRIQADPTRPLQIDPDGTVRQESVALGHLKLVEAPPPEALNRREGLYFNLDARQLAGLKPSQADVRQGHLESSNLGPAEAAVRLVNIMRQFESLQKAIQLGADMNRKSVDEVARVQA
jgi:flagellar basal-body rod protein FlgF